MCVQHMLNHEPGLTLGQRMYMYIYIYNAADGLAAGGCRELRFCFFAAHTRLLLARGHMVICAHMRLCA